MGLHVDLKKIWESNYAKQGKNHTRKGGLLINMGDNPTKASVMRKREANKKAYGLPQTFVANLKLPKA